MIRYLVVVANFLHRIHDGVRIVRLAHRDAFILAYGAIARWTFTCSATQLAAGQVFCAALESLGFRYGVSCGRVSACAPRERHLFDVAWSRSRRGSISRTVLPKQLIVRSFHPDRRSYGIAILALTDSS